MGITALLKQLAPCLADSHVERFRGQTVAVDGNTFIFRGCYSCSEQVGGVGTQHVFFVDATNSNLHVLRQNVAAMRAGTAAAGFAALQSRSCHFETFSYRHPST